MNNEVFLWEWKKFVEEDEEKKNMFLLVEWNSRVARTSVEEKREEKVMVDNCSLGRREDEVCWRRWKILMKKKYEVVERWKIVWFWKVEMDSKDPTWNNFIAHVMGYNDPTW
jgi:hypothetical protein